MMQSLNEKTALITGAGKGLGKAIALALAAEGVNLGLIARTTNDLEKVAEEAKSINSTIKVSVASANVGSYDEVKKAVSALTNDLSEDIDILINSAGILRTGSVLSTDVKEWEEVIQTNLFGTYYMIREILPLMTERQKGDILNIASTAGLKGSAQLSAYAASKAAVISLSESVMYEARKSNIRVSTVNPSTIATGMTLDAGFTDGNPERVLQPEDLAHIVVSHLKLPRRAFVKEIGLWSTNP